MAKSLSNFLLKGISAFPTARSTSCVRAKALSHLYFVFRSVNFINQTCLE